MLLLYTLLQFLQLSAALKCYHMNRKKSVLKPCSGYCATIFATTGQTGYESKVSYCIPQHMCLAAKTPMQIGMIGAGICQVLMDSTEGAVTKCSAAICQSNGCNLNLERSSTRLNDCSVAQCHMEPCHGTTLDEHTTSPYHSRTGSAMQTTGLYTGSLAGSSLLFSDQPVTRQFTDPVSDVITDPVTEPLPTEKIPTEKIPTEKIPAEKIETEEGVLTMRQEGDGSVTEAETPTHHGELPTTPNYSIVVLEEDVEVDVEVDVDVDVEKVTTPPGLLPTTGDPEIVITFQNSVTDGSDETDYDNGFMSDNTLEQTDVGAVKRVDGANSGSPQRTVSLLLLGYTLLVIL